MLEGDLKCAPLSRSQRSRARNENGTRFAKSDLIHVVEELDRYLDTTNRLLPSIDDFA